jgi:bifunctional non-homologous end joining protein LigD
VFDKACDLKLEGIVSKRVNDSYRSGRTKSWLKVKCGMEQEFVIIGWRPSQKAARPFSSLLLGVREDGELRYCGRVGTGYTEARLDELAAQFRKHARRTPPVPDVPPAIARQARFVEPVLVAEVAFRGWTRDGLVRQGSFKGLRGDKPAQAVIRERAMPTRQVAKAGRSRRAAAGNARAPSSPRESADEIEGVRITNPDRVLFAGQGITKRELIEYYLSVADAMLPHVVGRPLALLRCPQGSGKHCFFQKHANRGWPDAFRKIRIKEKSGADDYLYIEDAGGLVAAAQMGVLELHLWCCHVDRLEQPDRMVFDLDPDPDLPFAAVKQAARELKRRLLDLGLESFAMATGGKGVHVVLPLGRRHGWDQHRDFAEAMARVMAEDDPKRYVANMSKAKRRGRIFIDYLRNQRGATAIAPFSTRARPGAFVALPVSWQALDRLENAHPASVADAARKAAASRDPWPGYHQLRQSLPLAKLGLRSGD